MAIDDYVGIALLPSLVARLSLAAPHLKLAVRAIGGNSAHALLTSGDVDVVVGGLLGTPHKDCISQLLLKDPFVCVVRRDHPDVGRRLSLRRFTSLRHVVISPTAGGPTLVDRVLKEQHGLERTVAVWTAHYSAAPALVVAAPYVLTVATHIATFFAKQFSLRLFAPPIELGSLRVELQTHKRSAQDDALLWLRRELEAASMIPSHDLILE